MDPAGKVSEQKPRLDRQKITVMTEETTKALGYDVFDPMEVVLEFTADHGEMKYRKVDYISIAAERRCQVYKWEFQRRLSYIISSGSMKGNNFEGLPCLTKAIPDLRPWKNV